MSDIQVLEQKQTTVGGKDYLIVALPALLGLSLIDHMGSRGLEASISPAMQTQVLLRSLRYQNKEFTEETFNIHFSRRYKDILELTKQVLEFNLGDFMEQGDNPLAESEESATS